MEHTVDNALVRLRATFEGHDLTVITLGETPHWMAKEVGEALGYSEDGGAFVRAITRDWSDELVDGTDFHKLAGEDLAAAKVALGPDVIDPRTPSLLLLTESGVFAAALLSRQPAAARLRRWLSAEVLPKLARTGTFAAAPAADVAEAARLATRLTELRNLAQAGLLDPDLHRRLQETACGLAPADEPPRARDVELPERPVEATPLRSDGWVVVPERALEELLDAFIGRASQVPREVAVLDLTLAAHVVLRARAASRQDILRERGLPGRVALRRRWRWSDWQVRRLLDDIGTWCPPEHVDDLVGARNAWALGAWRGEL